MRASGLWATGLLVTVAMTGCGQAQEVTVGLPDDATVTYAFHDSSVPPPYHRSVTLTVTQQEAHIVIDSYGDVLADERAATPAAVWQQLGDALDTVASLTVDAPGEGCVGGTGIDLVVQSGDAAIVDLRPQFCAGSNETLEAPIATWIAPARDLFPPTDVLAPEGP